MTFPGYDAWKLATPPEYEEDEPSCDDEPHPNETAQNLKKAKGDKMPTDLLEKFKDKKDKKAAKDFVRMSMMDLQKEVGRKLPGSKYNTSKMVLTLKDGREVMFSRIGRNDDAVTTIEVWTDGKKGKEVRVTSVASAVSATCSTARCNAHPLI
jgi:hypothetical protein